MRNIYKYPYVVYAITIIITILIVYNLIKFGSNKLSKRIITFKINGERNSGTNYLYQILSKNNILVYDQYIDKQNVYKWKHGVPTDDYKNINERNIDIFIFRDLESWLVSMYFNPYHLQHSPRKVSFDEFLISKQYSSEKYMLDYRTKKILNYDDNGKTIFEIRKYKFDKIIEYYNRNSDVILVNLSYIQNSENLRIFLNELSNKYKFNLKKRLILNIPHTKNGTKQKNRIFNINYGDYKKIINHYKDTKIEDYINNLTFIMK